MIGTENCDNWQPKVSKKVKGGDGEVDDAVEEAGG